MYRPQNAIEAYTIRSKTHKFMPSKQKHVISRQTVQRLLEVDNFSHSKNSLTMATLLYDTADTRKHTQADERDQMVTGQKDSEYNVDPNIDSDIFGQEGYENSDNKIQANRNQNIGRNFIWENSLHAQTVQERQAVNQALRKQRTSDVQSRNSMNQWGNKFFGVGKNSMAQIPPQLTFRSQEWRRLSVHNSMLDQKIKKSAKNFITNSAFDEPVVQVVCSTDSIMTGFSRNKRELDFHTRNQSSINMMHSFKTLDLPGKDNEYGLVTKTLGNVQLAQNLNRSSQLDQKQYGRNPVIPSEYLSFKSKNEIIHNGNNKRVQQARANNGKSSFIKRM